ncbi:MAG: DUF2911 domain-containing protein [Gemmatimonadota bacterium]
MTHRTLIGAAAVVALVAGAPAHADAQIRASERGSVTQTLDGTTITIDYSRPSARGRELFGDVVPLDVVWTPGANWATTLETDKDIRINGVDVAAGAYSVWMTPREDAWTMTLNAETEFFHFQKPDPALGDYQIELTPEQGEHVEMLTWSFPSVSGDAAVLQMHWGETRTPMQVLVEPSKPVILTAEQRHGYLGSYDLTIVPGVGWPVEAQMRVTEAEDGMLRGWMSFPFHPGDELEFDMIPAGHDRFHAGLYRDGKIFNVETGVAFEFDVDGRAHGVTLRGIEGSPFGTGVRSVVGNER